MLLSAEQISKNYGVCDLLDRVSLYLNPGDRIGVVGRNGAGKSTLLRILAGEEEPDAGTVQRAPNVRLEYLPQDPAYDAGNTVLEQVFADLSPEARALAEYEAKTILTEPEVSVDIRLRDGEATATAWGCDLTYDYVKINGDYRT